MRYHLAGFNTSFEQEDYQGAMDNLKKIFTLKITLPDEIAYYYGITLIKQKNFVKGKEALQKYVQLQGEEGIFYSEAQNLLVHADAFICKKCKNTGSFNSEETCQECDGSGEKKIKCRNCSGKGLVLCSLCKGHLVYKRGSEFNEKYESCPQCKSTGRTDCVVCEGDGSNKILCIKCKGEGKENVNKKCEH